MRALMSVKRDGRLATGDTVISLGHLCYRVKQYYVITDALRSVLLLRDPKTHQHVVPSGSPTLADQVP